MLNTVKNKKLLACLLLILLFTLSLASCVRHPVDSALDDFETVVTSYEKDIQEKSGNEKVFFNFLTESAEASENIEKSAEKDGISEKQKERWQKLMGRFNNIVMQLGPGGDERSQ